jgi:uncharacterized protein YcbK (DUF882 family)
VIGFATALLVCTLGPACGSAGRGSGGAGELGRAGAGEPHSPPPPLPRSPAPLLPRFFFSGDGHLNMTDAHSEARLDVQYRRADGSYDPQALAAVRRFLRSREDGREGNVSLRLIELLDYVQDHYRPRSMLLISGYRSPEFNAQLRATGGGQASTSLHTQGLAADVSLPGLNLKRTWQDLRQRRTGGVGYYHTNNFLHIDTGAPRFWEETTSRVSENLSADNARMFVRTDFDRYETLDGAVLDLHSLTTFPVRIAPQARVASGEQSATVQIEPAEKAAVTDSDGCFTIAAPADAYQFRVVGGTTPPAAPRGTRSTLLLTTCEPRVGRTPAEIVSNPIEIRH